MKFTECVPGWCAMELWSSMKMPDFCQQTQKKPWGLNTVENLYTDIDNAKKITLGIIKGV